MSGSSLDGLDLAFVRFEEKAGKWRFDILETACIPYPDGWKRNLAELTGLSARDYLLMHTAYGHYLGNCINDFLEEKSLAFQVQLIASHGHTAFHMPSHHMTAQLGDGAAIAALTGIRTITDLRSVDLALGGQGAPIVPIGEKLLFPDYDLFLNLGGIANISANHEQFAGFDVCPANRVLNMLAAGAQKEYDENGILASGGQVDLPLLNQLNSLAYYGLPYPKSLSNEFGIEVVYPLIQQAGLSSPDALRTYVEHIVVQIKRSVDLLKEDMTGRDKLRMLITGGGAHNLFMTGLLGDTLGRSGVECVIPDANLINYKEALVMALMGVLRWREDINVMHSVTGASKDSINGAIWSV